MDRPNVILLCTGLALSLTTTVAPASFGERRRAEADFRPEITIGEAVLQLRGMGLLKFKRLISVYDAALYLGAGTQPADVLGDVAKRIEVKYRVGTEAKRFCNAGEKVLARTFSSAEIEAVRSRLDTINGWYPDPRPGDRCSITYIPGKGTELSFNGQSLGWIQGEDFARLYFSIWLGPKPASDSLKRALLSTKAR